MLVTIPALLVVFTCCLFLVRYSLTTGLEHTPHLGPDFLHFAVSSLVCSAVGANGGRFFTSAYYVLAVRPQLEYSEMRQTQQSPRPLLIKGEKLITVSN